MTRPRLLDLFCCQGGAGMGYHRDGLREAVPPIYTQYLGRQLLAHVEAWAA